MSACGGQALNALDYILAGLEEELRLERELGTRVVEFDRALLEVPADAPPAAPVRPVAAADTPVAAPAAATVRQPAAAYDFVFVHDKPLSDAAVTMMAKITSALGKTPESAPVVFEGELPKAKAYAVMGALALRKFFPGLKGVPGQWIEGERGEPVLVTYSPHYILRFEVVTQAVQKMKTDMWKSLKTLLQRTR